MLQQRGYYVIELSNGEKVQLRFCAGSLRKFCERNGGLTLKDLINFFGKEGEGVSLNMINSLLLCAAEYIKLSNKEPSEYTEYDADEWISELGGVAGPRLHKLVGEAIKSMLDTGETTETKKKEGKGINLGSTIGHGSRVESEAVGV